MFRLALSFLRGDYDDPNMTSKKDLFCQGLSHHTKRYNPVPKNNKNLSNFLKYPWFASNYVCLSGCLLTDKFGKWFPLTLIGFLPKTVKRFHEENCS